MNLPLKKELRKNIMQLQSSMEKEEQKEIPIRHYYANGFYAREMIMPAGVALVGKIHKSEHICILSKGDVTVVSEELSERIQAPYTYVSKPGAKRAIYAHSEVVWTTIHMTEETDPEQLEKELIAESYKALEVKKCPG